MFHSPTHDVNLYVFEFPIIPLVLTARKQSRIKLKFAENLQDECLNFVFSKVLAVLSAIAHKNLQNLGLTVVIVQ